MSNMDVFLLRVLTLEAAASLRLATSLASTISFLNPFIRMLISVRSLVFTLSLIAALVFASACPSESKIKMDLPSCEMLKDVNENNVRVTSIFDKAAGDFVSSAPNDQVSAASIIRIWS